MFNKLITKHDGVEIAPMEAKDCAAVSTLHGQRFSRAWSDGEFHALLSQDTVLGLVAYRQSRLTGQSLAGFVLAREVAGEAEILSIAVSAKLGGQGIGWRLMQTAIQEIRQRGGETIFLEVDEGNVPAIALYKRLRFSKVAERKAYYKDAEGRSSTALVMRLDLG